jgi:tRNA uridine 5-carboxymethylaminomethyl modification enzyme
LKKQGQKEVLTRALNSTRIDPQRFGFLGLGSDDRPTLAEWIRRPEARLAQLNSWIQEDLVHGVRETVETEIKYAGYISQQGRQVERLKGAERRRIPSDFSYAGVPGLSNEVREKLLRVRPETLGHAGRIPGVTPAAIAVLDVYLNLAS